MVFDIYVNLFCQIFADNRLDSYTLPLWNAISSGEALPNLQIWSWILPAIYLAGITLATPTGHTAVASWTLLAAYLAGMVALGLVVLVLFLVGGGADGTGVFIVTHSGVVSPDWFETAALRNLAVWLEGEATNPISCTAMGEVVSVVLTWSLSLVTAKLPAAHLAELFPGSEESPP